MIACVILLSDKITWYNIFISVFADINRIKSNFASSRGLTQRDPVRLKSQNNRVQFFNIYNTKMKKSIRIRVNLQVKELLWDCVRVLELVLQQCECFGAEVDLIGSKGNSGREIGGEGWILARNGGGGGGTSGHGGSPARTRTARDEVPQFSCWVGLLNLDSQLQ